MLKEAAGVGGKNGSLTHPMPTLLTRKQRDLIIDLASLYLIFLIYKMGIIIFISWGSC